MIKIATLLKSCYIRGVGVAGFWQCLSKVVVLVGVGRVGVATTMVATVGYCESGCSQVSILPLWSQVNVVARLV